MQTRSHKSPLTTLAIVGLLAAACGGTSASSVSHRPDSSHSTTSTTSTTTTRPAASTSTTSSTVVVISLTKKAQIVALLDSFQGAVQREMANVTTSNEHQRFSSLAKTILSTQEKFLALEVSLPSSVQPAIREVEKKLGALGLSVVIAQIGLTPSLYRRLLSENAALRAAAVQLLAVVTSTAS